ncbi:MAG: diguanylate cyclase [Thiovulaceae bacterium]|nr:diguanylate cyclase [Sulfurimonadaceae bacterium]
MKKLSLVKLLYAGLITSLIIVFSLSALSVLEHTRAIEVTKQILRHPFVVTNTVRDIRVDVRMLWEITNKAVYENIFEEESLKKIAGTEGKINQEFKLLRERYLGEPSDINSLEKTYKILDSQIHRALEIRNMSNSENASKYLNDNHVEENYHLMSDEINVIIKFAMNKAQELSSSADGELNENIHQQIVFSLAILSLGLVLGAVLIRFIRGKFYEINFILKNIQQHNFQKIPIDNNEVEEFRQLKEGINIMVDSIVQSKKIIEEKNLELQSTQQFLDFALQASNEGIWEWNLSSGEIKVNNIFEKMLGYAEGEWNKSEENMLKHTKVVEFSKSMELFEAHLEGLSSYYESEFEMRKKSGEWIWIQSRGKVIVRDEDGKALIASGTHTDVTLRKHIEEELKNTYKKLEQSLKTIQDAEESYRGLFNSVTHAIYIQDFNGKFIDVNHGAELMYGYTRDEFIGKTPGLISAPDKNDMQQLSEHINRAIAGEAQRFEFWGKRKNGEIFPKDVTIVRGKYFGKDVLIAVSVDIIKQKQLEQKLQTLVSEEIEKRIEKETLLAQESLKAMTDVLTGIPNRRKFDETYLNECKRAMRSDIFLSLIMIDIDFFKNYNDAYGHSAGDECLKEVANQLEDTIGRGSDFVSRYGGEEFILILPATDIEGTTNIAQKLQKSIEILNIPHAYSTVADHVTISLGCSTMKIKKESDCKKLLLHVDEMLYKAKAAGRNRVFFENEI